MYVCLCKAVTDKQIRRAIADGDNSMRRLRNRLEVCSDCCKCASEVKAILREETGVGGVINAIPLPALGGCLS